MPCGQCEATTKNGTRCKLRTCRTLKYCWIHLKKIDGLQIKKSEIPDAGLGLFSTKNRPYSKTKTNPTITYYSAERISDKPNEESDYILKVSKNHYLDSQNPRNFVGRYINSFQYHQDRLKRRANVRFTRGTTIYKKDDRYVVPIKQKTKINKGDELYINYGADYPIVK
tara:strand:- start:1809 stop:2315 length:507 start_codon:yes stop_codon:yes gene_type:complete